MAFEKQFHKQMGSNIDKAMSLVRNDTIDNLDGGTSIASSFGGCIDIKLEESRLEETSIMPRNSGLQHRSIIETEGKPSRMNMSPSPSELRILDSIISQRRTKQKNCVMSAREQRLNFSYKP